MAVCPAPEKDLFFSKNLYRAVLQNDCGSYEMQWNTKLKFFVTSDFCKKKELVSN